MSKGRETQVLLIIAPPREINWRAREEHLIDLRAKQLERVTAKEKEKIEKEKLRKIQKKTVEK